MPKYLITETILTEVEAKSKEDAQDIYEENYFRKAGHEISRVIEVSPMVEGQPPNDNHD